MNAENAPDERDAWLVLLAAGQGSRLAKAAGCPKQFLNVGGVPLFWLSLRTAAKVSRLAGAVLVFPQDVLEENRALALELEQAERTGLQLRFAAGGARRQDSVANGLAMVPETASRVLVHDSARPFFTADLAGRLLDSLEAGALAAIPGIAVTDTIKRVDKTGLVLETPPRAKLRAVQTPQAFDLQALCAAHAQNRASGDADVTDDAALMEACGQPVLVIPGEERNIKITNPADLEVLMQTAPSVPCTGFGYDVHRYGGTRPLVLCGVPVPCDFTIEAHSDGDVALHALMDALLGLIGAGDIGMLFPDSDPAFDGADSKALLAVVLERLNEAQVALTHADVTIVAQKPKIGPHKQAMQESLCRLLGLSPTHVNVKATTEEKLGFTGSLEGIKAYAAVTGLAPR